MTSTDEAPDLTARPATSEDAELLAGMFLAAREAAYPAMPRPVHGPDSVRVWFRELLGPLPGNHPDRETWVAERDGEVLGYLVLTPQWLDSLYVRPDSTGEGIGSFLMELAKGLRPEGFSLWVFETNARAQAFYRRHGLVTVRRTDGSTNEERSPDREMAWLGPDPVAGLRVRVDATDDELAELLVRRAALTGLIQQHKQPPGHAGRDLRREAEIVARMAARAPGLGAERLARIMDAVIAESLDAAAAQRGPDAAP